jgi:hypothetical protein
MFWMVLKIKSVLSVRVYTPIPVVLKFFCFLVMEKIKDKVLACFLKTHTNCKISRISKSFQRSKQELKKVLSRH